MTIRDHKTILLGSLLSLWIHLTLILLADSIMEPRENPDEVVFKIRTLGTKTGKDYLSIPVRKPFDLSFITPSPFSSLQQASSSTQQDSSPQIRSFKKHILKESLPTAFFFREDILALLNNTDLNLRFDPPKGVSEDELNTIEKIYYGFQRRMILAYYHSLFSSYNKLTRVNPRLRQSLEIKRDHLIGKIVFDHKGNILRIKFLKWSVDDHIQELFNETLKGIHSAPNPPKAFVETEGEFTVYYHLKINS